MQKSSHSPERIECGDREALAAFLMKYRSRLLRRIRGKLTAIGATEIDEEDILSTCARRLDLMCMGKRLPHLTEDELIAYALRTATNAAHNMILTESRRRRTLQRLWRESQHLHDEAVTEPDESAIQSLLAKLAEDDRRMVELPRLRSIR